MLDLSIAWITADLTFEVLSPMLDIINYSIVRKEMFLDG
jgi:hypothetical protein